MRSRAAASPAFWRSTDRARPPTKLASSRRVHCNCAAAPCFRGSRSCVNFILIQPAARPHQAIPSFSLNDK